MTGEITEEALKRRMARGAEVVGWTLQRLADETGENYKNVLRWVKGDVKVPAEFVVRYLSKIPVSPSWLLFGTGSPVVTGEDQGGPVLAPIDDEERAYLIRLLTEGLHTLTHGKRPPQWDLDAARAAATPHEGTRGGRKTQNQK